MGETGPATGVEIATVVFLHLAGPSGPLRSLEAELRWLAGRGPLTTVVPGPGAAADVVPGSGAAAEALAGAGEVVELDYEALTVPEGGPRGLVRAALRVRRDVRSFRAVIRARRPDLAIAVTSMLPAAAIAARVERVPLLVYCGELFAHRAGRGGPARAAGARLLFALTTRLADCLIACSRAVADQLAGSPAPVVTVYPPIGPRYAAGDGAGLRARFAIPAEAPLISSVGNLTAGRGQDLVVRALPAIRERLPDARYLIAGEALARASDRAFRERLVALIGELELEADVTLAGHVEDVADVYAAADVVVNPARVDESFGRVPFEAAVAGRPAVVTRVGALTELLRDGESTLVVAPEDEAALARAIVRLFDDPQLAERLAAGARALVAKRLTPERSLAGFCRAVEVTLERRGMSRG